MSNLSKTKTPAPELPSCPRVHSIPISAGVFFFPSSRMKDYIPIPREVEQRLLKMLQLEFEQEQERAKANRTNKRTQPSSKPITISSELISASLRLQHVQSEAPYRHGQEIYEGHGYRMCRPPAPPSTSTGALLPSLMPHMGTGTSTRPAAPSAIPQQPQTSMSTRPPPPPPRPRHPPGFTPRPPHVRHPPGFTPHPRLEPVPRRVQALRQPSGMAAPQQPTNNLPGQSSSGDATRQHGTDSARNIWSTYGRTGSLQSGESTEERISGLVEMNLSLRAATGAQVKKTSRQKVQVHKVQQAANQPVLKIFNGDEDDDPYPALLADRRLNLDPLPTKEHPGAVYDPNTCRVVDPAALRSDLGFGPHPDIAARGWGILKSKTSRPNPFTNQPPSHAGGPLSSSSSSSGYPPAAHTTTTTTTTMINAATQTDDTMYVKQCRCVEKGKDLRNNWRQIAQRMQAEANSANNEEERGD